VYVGYTHDAPTGAAAPFWGRAGKDQDRCYGGKPDPAFQQGCQVTSRVSRLTLKPGQPAQETVLLEDWCQQFPSHSIGDLVFDRSGALLVGGGDGAYFEGADIGNRGDGPSSCRDPIGEGGALRAQDLITPGDPVGLDGTIARIDPDTGGPVSGNPLFGAVGLESRILTYGLRNPYRFALRPGRNELWIADVGWNRFEEINVTRTDQFENFGWPCFEGDRSSAYRKVAPLMCGSLYNQPKAVSGPFFMYRQNAPVVPGEKCATTEASAISGIAFDSGRSFPAPLDGALFFADYIRGCIWAFEPRRFGAPHLESLQTFQTGSRFPVDLVKGPDGIYYPNIVGGTVQRISYVRPTVEATLRTKPRGLSVTFDGRAERSGTSITVKPGSTHRVSAPPKAKAKGKRLRFVRWSDGGDRVHDVTVSRGRTLTAIYGKR
jgi:glucose/arabinose dehydrogenase